MHMCVCIYTILDVKKEKYFVFYRIQKESTGKIHLPYKMFNYEKKKEKAYL